MSRQYTGIDWIAETASETRQPHNLSSYRSRCFTLEEIVAVNGYWKDEADPLYLGQEDSSHYPGDIDPKRSLIVAELGPDQLIALDYRRSAAPEVLFASDDARSPWRLVWGSVEELLSELAASD